MCKAAFRFLLCLLLVGLADATQAIAAQPSQSVVPPPEADATSGDELRLPAENVPATGSENEVWLVSARTRGACADQPRLAYWRYEAGVWVPASLEELASGLPLPTCVWTHGNWVSHDRAATMGWEVYERFKSCGAPAPFRLIIWSWPTDRSGNIRKDAQTKAVRADKFAYPLAWLVDKLPMGAPVSLLGFSYGARLDAGVLHLLGGGSQRGRYLEQDSQAPPRPMRGIFLSAAMDNFALAPNGQQGFALPFAQRIVNLYNSRDIVLRFYPLLWRAGGPKAAGHRGFVGYGGPFGEKMSQMNVANAIGPKHEWHRYFSSSVMSRIVEEALFLDVLLESNMSVPPHEPAADLAEEDTKRPTSLPTEQPTGPTLLFPAGI
ncbi:MAG: hypothetical protein MPJ50_09195 [Pirellulales bacterium]|nr:hypothetical protein [Pirellulales bacterium]